MQAQHDAGHRVEDQLAAQVPAFAEAGLETAQAVLGRFTLPWEWAD